MRLDKYSTPAARIEYLTGLIAGLGYTIEYGSHRSWVNPLTKTVVLHKSVQEAPLAFKSALLAHECRHVEQQHGSIFKRIWWLLKYLLSFTFRAHMEVDAEAHETVVRYWHTGALKVSHRLGGFRHPYYLPGDPERYTERIYAGANILIEADE